LQKIRLCCLSKIFTFQKTKMSETAILNWCENWVKAFKHGGIWAIPRSKLAFRVDKNSKKLILVAGTCGEEFHATKHWFSKIGWSVERYQDFQTKEVKNAS